MSENIYNPHGKEIRFINSNYKELFRIPDGGYISITRPDFGEEYIAQCKYHGEHHVDIGNECYHICQFAEIQERNGAIVKPEPEPEINAGYRITQRNRVGDKVFVLAHDPNAVQPWVTWQGYTDKSLGYDWGHYWSDKSTARTDLFRRTDAERTGRVYDHTTLIKQQKNRDNGAR